MAPKKRDLKLLSIWEEDDLIGTAGRIHATSIWGWLLRNPQCDVKDIPFASLNIPKKVYHEVINKFVKLTTKIVLAQDSARGDTTKLLIELQDGHRIETVIMKHRQRTTVCVSSQIGCQMGCRFCATGTLGIIGDLTSGEIVEQLFHANNVSQIRNVVYMGEGEPLQNFDNVKTSVNFLLDVRRFNLSAKHITVSTVGVVKNIYRLTTELPRVKLALSLHAPNQELRLKIVPSASAHKIEKLMEAVDHHIEYNIKNKERIKENHVFSVMIEYILIKGVNDLPEHAEELAILLTQSKRKDHVLLNLIPYNPTTVAEHFEAPTKENVTLFADICKAHNIMVRVRTEMGQDIAGACGQLALVNPGLPSKSENIDIEDIGKVLNKDKSMKIIKKKPLTKASPSIMSRFWSAYLNHGFHISISVFTISGIILFAYNRKRA